ncbi:hypothetical protein PUNSTDRAFT_113774 [Punctularia strigosozonata HHB-11173 SS5]|uniref:uncharacterized protein n=1 Tax=Punctularia strigosozonata (strain HHB-11173) TaxID=741275 RepID=UPI00044186A9|nr:uncharacterized protein PUNSTDRAFT_113774 [Punctularia strigosozonata HHB-11173 SS5]EIN08179.1 hypothetical protein PUNSTDRAFT_113774 [Punctularia strigosozonata HHB-11173 SS5]
MMFSRFIGFSTSVWNCGCMNAALICFNSSMRTVPGNFGEIVCGLSDTASCWAGLPSSGSSTPARSRMNVVLPMPFSPSITMISESVNEEPSTEILKLPRVFCRVLSRTSSSAVSTILKERASSRKRKFSVGMKPSKNMLIPTRHRRMVTTPYIDGLP